MKEERQPVFLSLIPTGTYRFPRYRIADQYLRYWTGSEWTENEEDGFVYESGNDACREMQRLLKKKYGKMKRRVFVAPVIVNLYSNHNITMPQLQDWLVKVAKLIIDSPQFGNGPNEGSLGLTKIDWTKMREVEK